MRELTFQEIDVVSGGERKPPSDGIRAKVLDSIYNAAYNVGHAIGNAVKEVREGARSGFQDK